MWLQKKMLFINNLQEPTLPFPLFSMRWSHQQMNPFPVEWKLHSGQPHTQDFLHLASRVFALRSSISIALACSQPVKYCPLPLIFCHPDKKLLFLSLRVSCWQSGQHLACKAGSCFHCCRSCASEPVHPCWPWCCLPNPNKSRAQTAPANIPWWALKARRKQSTDFLSLSFLQLYQLSTALQYSLLQTPSQEEHVPGKIKLCFLLSTKVMQDDQTLTATQLSFQQCFFFPGKAQSIFFRAAPYSSGLIKSVSWAPCDGVSSRLPHDISGAAQNLSVLCCSRVSERNMHFSCPRRTSIIWSFYSMSATFT